LNYNLEKLQTDCLTEIDFQFDIIGLTETKITKTTCNVSFEIPGYTFEYVATPLASGVVALFINVDLNYTMLERVCCEAFEELWIEISLGKPKHVICGVIYRQHNSPDQFTEYSNDTIEKMAYTGKTLYLMGDFNLCLLKTESSSCSQDFLLALQSFYLLQLYWQANTRTY